MTRCSNCDRVIAANKEYRNAGKAYCSKTCQTFAALTEIEKAVRMVVLTICLLGAFYWGPPRPAWAHDFYHSWTQPGHPESSCCNGMKTEEGVETGDCSVTSAKWERNHWWAFIATKKIWVQVPDDRIVNYKTDDADAHLCYSQTLGNIYCFRPPKLGM